MTPLPLPYLKSLLFAHTPSVSRSERWRATLGALLSMSVCGWALHWVPLPLYWLIAPIGASAVILFALSHSPLAQPWPVVGSYTVATVAGLLAVRLIPDPIWAMAVAVALTIWLMARLNCIHPPGGALALFIAHEHHAQPDAMGHTVALVALNVGLLLLTAVLIHNLILRRRYPYSAAAAPARNAHRTSDAPPMQRAGLDHTDLEAAVRTLDIFVDVQEEELVQLYNLAVENAFSRHLGLTCGDIMSRDVVTTEFATELDEAWNQLRRHKVKALPVVDKFQRLIGILTVADFLRQMDDTTAAGLAVSLQGLLRRTPGPNSDKAEVVGQIMSTHVYTVRADTPIVALIHELSDQGLHHVPVLDDSRRVVGIVTHSDVIAALYRRVALSVQD